ncbi:hypothetical protein BDQ17DRAFT_1528344 [Cyathus striatus]|nr:hypothetical protein BDQ17DRAFT_1528344 [Cyathus striatus]
MKRWDTERSAWAEQRVRWKEEEGKRELVRREWGLAVLRHQKWTERVEEQRAEWDLEAREHWRLKDSMDAQRKKWDQETRDRDIEHERRKVEDSDWQKRSQRRKDEMEERDKAGLFFSPLQKGKCTTFNTRRYRSELENLPRDFTGNVLRACMDTSAEINGRSVTPVYCEDLGSAGVWGIWEADGEVGCTPWWSRYKDKGCTAPESGLREIEQHLENLYPNESYDWRDVCGTTPASFGGRNFAGPTNCVNWVSFVLFLFFLISFFVIFVVILICLAVMVFIILPCDFVHLSPESLSYFTITPCSSPLHCLIPAFFSSSTTFSSRRFFLLFTITFFLWSLSSTPSVPSSNFICLLVSSSCCCHSYHASLTSLSFHYALFLFHSSSSPSRFSSHVRTSFYLSLRLRGVGTRTMTL